MVSDCLWLRASHKAELNFLARTAVLSRLYWGQSPSKATRLAVGSLQFPWLLFHLGLSIGQLTTWRLAFLRVGEQES